MIFDEVFERIKLATGTRTQVELAEVLDIRQSSISDAKRRNSVPADWYMKLFEQFGLNPDWLKKGTGPMYLRTEQGYVPVDAPASISVLQEDSAKYGGADAKNAVVPVYATHTPADADQQTVLGRLSIPQSFAGPGLQVVRMDSSAMEPHIRKGAFVGIDTTTCQIYSGEIYALSLPYEGMVFKRVYIDAQNSRILLRAENQDHPEVALPLNGDNSPIVGRVTWVLQRL